MYPQFQMVTLAFARYYIAYNVCQEACIMILRKYILRKTLPYCLYIIMSACEKKALSFQWCGHMVVMIAPSLTVNSCHIVLWSRCMMKVENLLSKDVFRDLVFFFLKE